MAARLQHSDDEFTEAHEINVTPFIDVMLVLLIIFMVAAPLSTVDVPVDLPASTATPQPRPDKPLFLSVQKDLQLSLGDDPVTREGLAAALESGLQCKGRSQIGSRRWRTQWPPFLANTSPLSLCLSRDACHIARRACLRRRRCTCCYEDDSEASADGWIRTPPKYPACPPRPLFFRVLHEAQSSPRCSSP